MNVSSSVAACKDIVRTLVLRRNYYVDRAYYTARFAWRFATSDEILLIYSPGRCGSVSVLRSLERLQLRSPLFNIHRMNRDRIKDYTPWPDGQAFLESYLARRLDRRWTDKTWKVIVLVREPIARQISLFCKALFVDQPEMAVQFNAGQLSADALRDLFLREFFHLDDGPTYSPKHLLDWCDNEIKRVFGIDLFERAFPKTSGYDLLTSERLTMLVIKTERINGCWNEAIRSLLGVTCPLVTTNKADEQRYYGAYRVLQDGMILPGWYLERMHESKYARHFYTDDELRAVRAKHTAGRDLKGRAAVAEDAEAGRHAR